MTYGNSSQEISSEQIAITKLDNFLQLVNGEFTTFAAAFSTLIDQYKSCTEQARFIKQIYYLYIKVI